MVTRRAKVRLIRNVRAHRARGLLGAQSRAPDERFDICVSRILIFGERLFWKLIWLISLLDGEEFSSGKLNDRQRTFIFILQDYFVRIFVNFCKFFWIFYFDYNDSVDRFKLL